MKKLTLLFSLFLIVVSCSSNSPKSVAVNFFEAISEGDFETAKKYGDTATNSLFDLVLAFGADKMKEEIEKNKDKVKFEVTDEEIDGDEAKVTVKSTELESGKEETSIVQLKKIDGEWKVSMSKESLQNKEGGASPL